VKVERSIAEQFKGLIATTHGIECSIKCFNCCCCAYCLSAGACCLIHLPMLGLLLLAILYRATCLCGYIKVTFWWATCESKLTPNACSHHNCQAKLWLYTSMSAADSCKHTNHSASFASCNAIESSRKRIISSFMHGQHWILSVHLR